MCVNRFNIADIARIVGIQILRERNGETYAVCPFCGDRRGKFSYIVQKGRKQNIYHCYNCGVGGTGVELYMNLSGKNYSAEGGYERAVVDIFQAINGNTDAQNFHHETENKVIEQEVVEKASDGQCSSVYYAMLKELPLIKKHKEDLLRRGLTEDDIKRFRFRSTPKDRRGLCKKLLANGYHLEGVPGFFKNKRGEWDIAIPGSGYFCPVFDGEMNYITGFQIRMDEPKNGAKYLWFSSSGRNAGVSSGALATCLPGESSKCIIVTEGILKATVIYALLKGKITVIGVPGIGNILCLNSFLERYENNAYVIEAYDMDKIYKVSYIPLLRKAESLAKSKDITLDELFELPEYKEEFHDLQKSKRVYDAAKVLRDKINEYNIGVHPLTWDTDEKGYWKDNFKGLDDFLYGYPDKDKFLYYILNKAHAALAMQDYFAECS